MAAKVPSSLIRLNKLVASAGACSRREADHFLSKGWVQVQGLCEAEVLTPGTKVHPDTQFRFLPAAMQEMDSAVSLILHKPLGIVSGQPEGPHQTPAVKLLSKENRFRLPKRTEEKFVSNPHRLQKLAVAGRLDAHSSGLLLFTQSGKLAQTIIGPDSEVEKEYLVRIEDRTSQRSPSSSLLLGSDEQVKESASEKVERLLEGVHSEGDFLEAADIRIQNADQLNFVLKGGKYHHIRRMCEIVGWHVHALKRVRIGSIRLQDLPVGKWRYLDAQECKTLR